MHVLPLPFGFRLAVAVLPRRDAELMRGDHTPDPPARGTYAPSAIRQRVLSDLRYADQRQHVF